MPFLEKDRQLLQRCLNRDPGAWEEFVDRVIGVFVHVITHTAHSRSVQLRQDDIDDLCSEIFLTLLKNDFAVLRHFKGRSSLLTYLTVVARRIAVKEISVRRKSEAMGHVLAHQSSLEAGGVEPPRSVDDIDQVKALIDQLPASEASIVRMYYLEGKSYSEIAKSLGISPNSVGPTLNRARDRMKQMKSAVR